MNFSILPDHMVAFLPEVKTEQPIQMIGLMDDQNRQQKNLIGASLIKRIENSFIYCIHINLKVWFNVCGLVQ